MASSSETGNAKNIANFKLLFETNVGFGPDYNPSASNPRIQLPAMLVQYTDCNTLQQNVNTQNGIFKPLLNHRRTEFASLDPLVRRVRSSAKSCGASAAFFANVDSVVKKILGDRVSKPEPTSTDPAGTSASQQSFDSKADNFDKLIEILRNQPLYSPNEPELTVMGLEGKQTIMEAANNAVKSGAAPYNKAISDRNKALYTTTTGLVDVAQQSKDYVRSKFGYSSPEFKLVGKITFKQMVKVD
jgi:hypothetical protein